MKKYVVRYESTDGDICSVWTYANSESEAETNTKDEYWDVARIVSVRQA